MQMSSLLQFCGRRTSSCADSIENGADVDSPLASRPRSRVIRYIRIFPLIIGMLSLSLGLPFGCGDDVGRVGPGDPAKIVAVNGLYYKGAMGDTISDTVLQFAVADKNDNYLPNQQIQLYLVEGDGHLPPKSITTDSSGTAGFPYVFNGSLGHAVIRLIAPDIDTLDILLRANTLILEPGGQAQYVLLSDTYEQVKGFNGLPDQIDETSFLVIPVYESSLGVVVILEDLNDDEIPDNGEPVLGIFVNTIYEGTTNDSIPIGIGSSISDVRTVFGLPNKVSIYRDTVTGDSAVEISYASEDFQLLGGFDPDTTIEEIQLIENLEKAPAKVTSPYFHHRK